MEIYQTFINQYIKYFAHVNVNTNAFFDEINENELYKHNKYYKVFYNESGMIMREEYYVNQKLSWFFLYHYDSRDRLYLRETYDQDNVCIYYKNFENADDEEQSEEEDAEQSFIDDLVSGFNVDDMTFEKAVKEKTETIPIEIPPKEPVAKIESEQDMIDRIVAEELARKERGEEPETSETIEEESGEEVEEEDEVEKENKEIIEETEPEEEKTEQQIDAEKPEEIEAKEEQETDIQLQPQAQEQELEEKLEETKSVVTSDKIINMVNEQFQPTDIKGNLLKNKLIAYIRRYQKLLNKDITKKDLKYLLEEPFKKHVKIYYDKLNKVYSKIIKTESLEEIVAIIDNVKTFKKLQYLENMKINLKSVNQPKNACSSIIKYYKAITSERHDLKGFTRNKIKQSIIKKIEDLMIYFKNINDLIKNDYRNLKRNIENISSNKLKKNLTYPLDIELYLERQIFKTLNKLNKIAPNNK